MSNHAIQNNSVNEYQKYIPLITNDLRIVGFATERTDNVFVYENNIGLPSDLKGVELKLFATYKKINVDIGPLGIISMYLQASIPNDQKQINTDWQRFYCDGMIIKNRADLIATLNQIDLNKII